MDPFRSLRSSAVPPGRFVGEGIKVVRRMLEAGCVERLLLTPEWRDELTARIPADAAVEVAPHAEMETIVGHRLHQGLLALGRIPPPPGAIPRGLVVALDGVADAENVGAILRTCAAFGVDAVLVGPGTCSPWVRRAVRVSLAAPLVVPCVRVPDLVAAIRSLDFPAYAAHIHGPRRDVADVDLKPPVCLVLGGEADGVSTGVLAACREVVYIPMAGRWDCLNVAASAAVLLFASRRGAPASSRDR